MDSNETENGAPAKLRLMHGKNSIPADGEFWTETTDYVASDFSCHSCIF